MTRSLTEFTKSSGNGRDRIVRVSEWRVVSGAPAELSSKADDDRVLNGVLRREVTNFLLRSIVLVDFGHELSHLLHGQLGRVTDVVQSLDGVEVSHVVHEPQVIVVSHGHVELLHKLTAVAAARDGTINLERSGEELLVFLVNLVNHLRRVNVLLVSGPVDGSELLSTSGLLVVEVKDAPELSVLLARRVSVGSGAESVQPLGSELVVYYR